MAGKFLNRWNTNIPKDKIKAYREYLAKYKKGDGYGDAEDYDIKGAFMAGEKPDERGHMTDRFKKPNHPTFSKSSQYNGKNGEEGGDWDESTHTFNPGKSNTRYRSSEELQQYFKQVEEPGGWRLSDTWRKIQGGRNGRR